MAALTLLGAKHQADVNPDYLPFPSTPMYEGIEHPEQQANGDQSDDEINHREVTMFLSRTTVIASLASSGL
jgi:hypothetical protein